MLIQEKENISLESKCIVSTFTFFTAFFWLIGTNGYPLNKILFLLASAIKRYCS